MEADGSESKWELLLEVVGDTMAKEKVRTNNNWIAEWNTILVKDDEKTLSNKHSRVYKESR